MYYVALRRVVVKKLNFRHREHSLPLAGFPQMALSFLDVQTKNYCPGML